MNYCLGHNLKRIMFQFTSCSQNNFFIFFIYCFHILYSLSFTCIFSQFVENNFKFVKIRSNQKSVVPVIQLLPKWSKTSFRNQFKCMLKFYQFFLFYQLFLSKKGRNVKCLELYMLLKITKYISLREKFSFDKVSTRTE